MWKKWGHKDVRICHDSHQQIVSQQQLVLSLHPNQTTIGIAVTKQKLDSLL